MFAEDSMLRIGAMAAIDRRAWRGGLDRLARLTAVITRGGSVTILIMSS
jgi:hypothetical protein